ncbi:MAG: hypothetical protein KF832_06845 [Caldilineaceae bacterium]|nr:hypothetical protein [Caldilineaceae bacterium]
MTSLEKAVTMNRLEVRPLVWSLVLMLYLSAFIPSVTLALVLTAFISFQALKEFYSMMPLRRAERYLVFFGYLSIPLQWIWVGTQSYALALVFIPCLIFVLAAWLLSHYETNAQALNSTLKIGWGLFTLVLGFSHVGLLLMRQVAANALSEFDSSGAQGNLLLYLLLIVHSQTMMQAILMRLRVNEWSRLLFKPSLTGLAGWLSVLGAASVAWGLGPWLLTITPGQATISGLLIGVGAYLASVTLRSIQQALEIHEQDRHLPGLGGILLYIYPFAYAAPLFFYYVNFFT